MTESVEAQAVPTVDEMVGEKLAFILWRRKISQGKFAPILGVTQSGLSKKLRGVGIWTAEDLLRAAYALNIEPAELLKPLSAGYDEALVTQGDEGSDLRKDEYPVRDLNPCYRRERPAS